MKQRMAGEEDTAPPKRAHGTVILASPSRKRSTLQRNLLEKSLEDHAKDSSRNNNHGSPRKAKTERQRTTTTTPATFKAAEPIQAPVPSNLSSESKLSSNVSKKSSLCAVPVATTSTTVEKDQSGATQARSNLNLDSFIPEESEDTPGTVHNSSSSSSKSNNSSFDDSLGKAKPNPQQTSTPATIKVLEPIQPPVPSNLSSESNLSRPVTRKNSSDTISIATTTKIPNFQPIPIRHPSNSNLKLDSLSPAKSKGEPGLFHRNQCFHGKNPKLQRFTQSMKTNSSSHKNSEISPRTVPVASLSSNNSYFTLRTNQLLADPSVPETVRYPTFPWKNNSNCSSHRIGNRSVDASGNIVRSVITRFISSSDDKKNSEGNPMLTVHHYHHFERQEHCHYHNNNNNNNNMLRSPKMLSFRWYVNFGLLLFVYGQVILHSRLAPVQPRYEYDNYSQQAFIGNLENQTKERGQDEFRSMGFAVSRSSNKSREELQQQQQQQQQQAPQTSTGTVSNNVGNRTKERGRDNFRSIDFAVSSSHEEFQLQRQQPQQQQQPRPSTGTVTNNVGNRTKERGRDNFRSMSFIVFPRNKSHEELQPQQPQKPPQLSTGMVSNNGFLSYVQSGELQKAKSPTEGYFFYRRGEGNNDTSSNRTIAVDEEGLPGPSISRLLRIEVRASNRDSEKNNNYYYPKNETKEPKSNQNSGICEPQPLWSYQESPKLIKSHYQSDYEEHTIWNASAAGISPSGFDYVNANYQALAENFARDQVFEFPREVDDDDDDVELQLYTMQKMMNRIAVKRTKSPRIYTAAICKIQPKVTDKLQHFAHAMEEFYMCFDYWMEFATLPGMNTNADRNRANQTAVVPVLIYDRETQLDNLVECFENNSFMKGLNELLTEQLGMTILALDDYYDCHFRYHLKGVATTKLCQKLYHPLQTIRVYDKPPHKGYLMQHVHEWNDMMDKLLGGKKEKLAVRHTWREEQKKKETWRQHQKKKQAWIEHQKKKQAWMEKRRQKSLIAQKKLSELLKQKRMVGKPEAQPTRAKQKQKIGKSEASQKMTKQMIANLEAPPKKAEQLTTNPRIAQLMTKLKTANPEAPPKKTSQTIFNSDAPRKTKKGKAGGQQASSGTRFHQPTRSEENRIITSELTPSALRLKGERRRRRLSTSGNNVDENEDDNKNDNGDENSIGDASWYELYTAAQTKQQERQQQATDANADHDDGESSQGGLDGADGDVYASGKGSDSEQGDTDGTETNSNDNNNDRGIEDGGIGDADSGANISADDNNNESDSKQGGTDGDANTDDNDSVTNNGLENADANRITADENDITARSRQQQEEQAMDASVDHYDDDSNSFAGFVDADTNRIAKNSPRIMVRHIRQQTYPNHNRKLSGQDDRNEADTNRRTESKPKVTVQKKREEHFATNAFADHYDNTGEAQLNPTAQNHQEDQAFDAHHSYNDTIAEDIHLNATGQNYPQQQASYGHNGNLKDIHLNATADNHQQQQVINPNVTDFNSDYAYTAASSKEEVTNVDSADNGNDYYSHHVCSRPPRIGILNRRKSRSILNAEELARDLSDLVYVYGSDNDNNKTTAAHVHNLTSPVNVVYFENKSLEEQVDFFRSNDILVSGHGAQLTGLPFMAGGETTRCRQVLEFFPKNYAIPYYFGSLAVQSGLRHSFVYFDDGRGNGKKKQNNNNFGPYTHEELWQQLEPSALQQIMPWEIKFGDTVEKRREARMFKFCPRTDDMVSYVVQLVMDWYHCHGC